MPHDFDDDECLPPQVPRCMTRKDSEGNACWNQHSVMDYNQVAGIKLLSTKMTLVENV